MSIRQFVFFVRSAETTFDGNHQTTSFEKIKEKVRKIFVQLGQITFLPGRFSVLFSAVGIFTGNHQLIVKTKAKNIYCQHI